jgi:PPK2 family polyphosphate:nucleotide phosphotransferase
MPPIARSPDPRLGPRLLVRSRGFRLADRDPGDDLGLSRKQAKARRAADLERLADLQECLYAEGARALLVVLQGLDAAGKDGVVKHVLRGVDPQGLSVTAFKEPTRTELAHDFLWRAQAALPARGSIGAFNRSHYEEVLVVRVHPELLAAEHVDPARAREPRFWRRRLRDIATWERHLTRDGTRVVKLFLHISRAEQRRRFLARAEDPAKLWKFSARDVLEHGCWDAYQQAYEAALRATSTAQEPWYVIPADHKWVARTAAAAIMTEHLEAMDPRYPAPSDEQRAEMEAAIAELRVEG